DRTKPQQEKLTAYFRSQASPAWKKLDAEYRKLDAQYKAFAVTTPVMREGLPRETHVQIRGNYQALGDTVSPGLPAVVPAPPPGEPMNRLALARWLVSPENPLTARVAA